MLRIEYTEQAEFVNAANDNGIAVAVATDNYNVSFINGQCVVTDEDCYEPKFILQ